MMSGSPKYTNVYLAEQRRAQLEAARRARAAERRRREEEARRRRIAAGVERARSRAGAVTARLDQLGAAAHGLPQRAEVGTVLTGVRAIGADLAAPIDEAGLKRVGSRLRDAERSTDRLGVAVARQLTHRRHDAALAAVVAPLEHAQDRARLDPAGYATVTSAIGAATARVGDEQRFPEAHQRLGLAVEEHLDRVRDRQAMLARLAAESDEVAARLRGALADAAEHGVEVPERAGLASGLAELDAERDGAHVSRWERRLAELGRAAETVTAAVEARLDQLDRIAIVVEAASAALPAAGLQVMPGSLVESGETVSFRALRSDGNTIELTVHPGDGRGTRLEYRAEGADIVLEQTGEGETSRCDLTADLLERFHTELGAQGVEADGLHWEGKPTGPRPPERQHAVAPVRRGQELGR
jgi:hypothetical protein